MDQLSGCRPVTSAPSPTNNPTLDLIMDARWQVVRARSKLTAAMKATDVGGPLAAQLPTSNVGIQAANTFRGIAGGLPCPVYKLSLNGFDNHSRQKTKHADLLSDVANTLAALRTALIAAGKSDSTLIMSYSEFGRRIEENGSAGTDHGTAAPLFFLGGKVVGGLYGTQPTLNLSKTSADMELTMDFRILYASTAEWLGISPQNRKAGLRGTDREPIRGLFAT